MPILVIEEHGIGRLIGERDESEGLHYLGTRPMPSLDNKAP